MDEDKTLKKNYFYYLKLKPCVKHLDSKIMSYFAI